MIVARCLSSLTKLAFALMVWSHARKALGQPPVFRNPACAGPSWPGPVGRWPARASLPKRVSPVGCGDCLKLALTGSRWRSHERVRQPHASQEDNTHALIIF